MPQNVSIQLSETWKSICDQYSALDHHLTVELITKNLDAFVVPTLSKCYLSLNLPNIFQIILFRNA